ncbi:hypothetical protein EYF80_035502 [Liparis tanakae]|uniref:Uncharacterized protein n=1 Tax=Liparis tanakae TaxID=230148 RepID=A0A4Z2GNE7_9TELE|nr:hypothetical protein EYF80_035502 [Liparis tanakae]
MSPPAAAAAPTSPGSRRKLKGTSSLQALKAWVRMVSTSSRGKPGEREADGPDSAYRLLLFLSMSSFPRTSGREHRGVDMSLRVSVSGRENPALLDAAEPLHEPDGVLDALFGLQPAGARVGRREVAVPAQPILHKKEEHLNTSGRLGVLS